jgi:hypothetical protein
MFGWNKFQIVKLSGIKFWGYFFNIFILAITFLLLMIALFLMIYINVVYFIYILLFILIDAIFLFKFGFVMVFADSKNALIFYNLGLSRKVFKLSEIIYCNVTSLPWYKLAEVETVSGFSSPDLTHEGNAIEVHLNNDKIFRFKLMNPQAFLDYLKQNKDDTREEQNKGKKEK